MMYIKLNTITKQKTINCLGYMIREKKENTDNYINFILSSNKIKVCDNYFIKSYKIDLHVKTMNVHYH